MILPAPRSEWTEGQLRREFALASKEEQAYYRGLMEELKPFESKPLQASSLAIEAIQAKRRYEGTKHLSDPKRRTFGNLKGSTTPWWPRQLTRSRRP